MEAIFKEFFSTVYFLLISAIKALKGRLGSSGIKKKWNVNSSILEKNQNMSRPVSITAARCVAWRAIVGDMKCFKALHGASEALAIAAIVKTHISSLFNGDHFHCCCAMRNVALRSERNGNTVGVSISLATQRHAQP